MSTGSAARCGLNSTVPASAAWNTPSPNWDSSRVPSSRRKSPRSRRWRIVVSAGTPVTLRRPEAIRSSPTSRTAADRNEIACLYRPGSPRRDQLPLPGTAVWGTLDPMTPVPASPDPESGPPTRPVTGQRRASAVPALSIGCLDDVRPGALLVAMPALTDPTFAGTVVFVLDHSDSGTLGVVLGRPSQVDIRDVLPGWCDLAVEPSVFHVGGPCETDTALCLAVSPPALSEPSGPLRRVAGDVYLVDLDSDTADLAFEITGLRVFAGYAGWSPGQRSEEH